MTSSSIFGYGASTMSEWGIFKSEQFLRDLKKMNKRYPRETDQMLANLLIYQRTISIHDNPLLLVEYPFVHREAVGCHAITQQPLVSSTQTRLYLYCHIQGNVIHLICMGDKQSQSRDNKFCAQYVNNL